jgi:hypothetical protein
LWDEGRFKHGAGDAHPVERKDLSIGQKMGDPSGERRDIKANAQEL